MQNNLEAAKKLLQKYKNITLEDIIDCYIRLKSIQEVVNGYHVMHKLTGFGQCGTCSLCKAVEYKGCNICIYSMYSKFNYPCLNISYYLISNAKTPEKIYYGLQKRIKFLERTIELWKTRSN